MTSTTAPPTPTADDRRRQVAVTAAEVFCVLGTLVGLGVLGTRVEESSGGALSADATLLAPAGPAFSIWTPIYLGLLGYTVWQWLPEQATDTRHRRTGWLAAASMVLNALWLLVTQQGWLWASVVVIGALVAVLGVLVARLTDRPSYGNAESVLVDGTFGLYLGWVCVAVAANVTAVLVASGADLGSAGNRLAALVVLAAVAAVGVLLARRMRGRWSVALAASWGLAWLAWGRLADEPASVVVALGAVAAAAVVLGATARAHARLST
ncbi:tryptophan-rich sensory protein [Phycicoccus sp. CSK15P-2]|uniref:TspO/MBR family protein n=1 Tax=Phycicoccus sp. CSK15P-2 TaxID=2807627 RepID=UPI00194E26C5|nr:TspO/MBR family protein [Phycicoccus sp. CSK15P-2]MBM6404428.1 tryptophan-rich sensory protein [Phycicoccus sp. CSK15P-2]